MAGDYTNPENLATPSEGGFNWNWLSALNPMQYSNPAGWILAGSSIYGALQSGDSSYEDAMAKYYDFERIEDMMYTQPGKTAASREATTWLQSELAAPSLPAKLAVPKGQLTAFVSPEVQGQITSPTATALDRYNQYLSGEPLTPPEAPTYGNLPLAAGEQAEEARKAMKPREIFQEQYALTTPNTFAVNTMYSIMDKLGGPLWNSLTENQKQALLVNLLKFGGALIKTAQVLKEEDYFTPEALEERIAEREQTRKDWQDFVSKRREENANR